MDVTLEELNESKIVIPRAVLVRWVHESYFKDAVIGCYVRLGIGKVRKGNRRLNRPYAIPPFV